MSEERVGPDPQQHRPEPPRVVARPPSNWKTMTREEKLAWAGPVAAAVKKAGTTAPTAAERTEDP